LFIVRAKIPEAKLFVSSNVFIYLFYFFIGKKKRKEKKLLKLKI